MCQFPCIAVEALAAARDAASRKDKGAAIRAALEAWLETAEGAAWLAAVPTGAVAIGPFARHAQAVIDRRWADVKLRWERERARDEARWEAWRRERAARPVFWRELSRQMARRGFTPWHTSSGRAGRVASKYYRRGEFVARISDHELPMTAEREFNWSLGRRSHDAGFVAESFTKEEALRFARLAWCEAVRRERAQTVREEATA